MGYGTDNMSEEEQQKLSQELKLNNNLEMSTYEEVEQLNVRDELKEKLQITNAGIEGALKDAERDTLTRRYQEYAKSEYKVSGWFSNLFKASKKNLNEKMNEAYTEFRNTSMSYSQRSKRGERFRSKAGMQAKMINELDYYHSQRNGAVKYILEKERNERFTGEVDTPFMEGVRESIETEKGVVLNDVAAYMVIVETDKTLDSETISDTAKIIEDLSNYKTDDLAEWVLNLDLKQFEYNNDSEFSIKYAAKLATLRAASHGKYYMEKLSKTSPLRQDKELEKKIRLINEILEDYESRAQMMKSPYYVLLAGKDLDKLSDDDLKDRIAFRRRETKARRNYASRDKDLALISYMEAVLERRKKRSFGKGKTAEGALNDLEKNDEIMEKQKQEAREKQQEEDNKRWLKENAARQKKEQKEAEAREKPLIRKKVAEFKGYKSMLAEDLKYIQKHYPEMEADKQLEKALELYVDQHVNDSDKWGSYYTEDKRSAWLRDAFVLCRDENLDQKDNVTYYTSMVRDAQADLKRYSYMYHLCEEIFNGLDGITWNLSEKDRDYLRNLEIAARQELEKITESYVESQEKLAQNFDKLEEEVYESLIRLIDPKTKELWADITNPVIRAAFYRWQREECVDFEDIARRRLAAEKNGYEFNSREGYVIDSRPHEKEREVGYINLFVYNRTKTGPVNND